MAAGITKLDGIRSGHSVSVLGYATIGGAKEYNCILIADGWNTTMKYINYDKTDFKDTFGLKIHMK